LIFADLNKRHFFGVQRLLLVINIEQ